MKMSKFNLFFAVIFVSILVFTGCSKDSKGPVDPIAVINAEAKLTLNGAGYTNKSVTLSNGLGAFSPTDTLTAIQFSGMVDNDSLYFAIIFNGNQAGTFNWNDDNGAIIYRTTTSGNYLYLGITQGITTVSSYGAVNGKIEGTINGKLIEQTSKVELNINGSFSAVRVPDNN